jgi:hypothetical protein
MAKQDIIHTFGYKQLGFKLYVFNTIELIPVIKQCMAKQDIIHTFGYKQLGFKLYVFNCV